MGRQCPYCGERSNDGMLCHRCVKATKRALARIIELWPTLQETITRRDRIGEPSEIRAQSIYGPLPYREPASNVANRVRADLVGWVRICADDYGADLPRDTVPAMCRLLIDRARQLRTSNAAAGWASDMVIARDSILRAVDLTDRRAPAGPCPEVTADNEPCPGVIVTTYPVDETVPPRMDCTKPTPDAAVCSRSWPSKEWRALGPRILARQAQIDGQKSRGRKVEAESAVYDTPAPWLGGKVLLSVGDASVIYGVERSKLEWWLRTGKLTRHPIVTAEASGGRPTTVAVDPVEVAARIEEAIAASLRRGKG